MSESLKPAIELLDCPFCGGEAELLPADDRSAAMILCSPCLAMVHGEYDPDAVSTWNRRASQPASDTPDPRDEVIAEMREALTELVAAMRRYQQDTDDLPPLRHVAMMARARAALSKREGSDT